MLAAIGSFSAVQSRHRSLSHLEGVLLVILNCGYSKSERPTCVLEDERDSERGGGRERYLGSALDGGICTSSAGDN